MGDERGGWKGLDTGQLRDHLHAATAVGRMAGAAKAVELGYGIEADPGPSGRLGGWAIAGIPKEAWEVHATRSAQIEEAVARRFLPLPFGRCSCHPRPQGPRQSRGPGGPVAGRAGPSRLPAARAGPRRGAGRPRLPAAGPGRARRPGRGNCWPRGPPGPRTRPSPGTTWSWPSPPTCTAYPSQSWTGRSRPSFPMTTPWHFRWWPALGSRYGRRRAWSKTSATSPSWPTPSASGPGPGPSGR